MKKNIFAALCMVPCLAACSTIRDNGAERTTLSESDRLEANKALARVWFEEIINGRNLDAMTDAYSPD